MFWVESISGIISRKKYLLGQNLQSEELLLVFIVVRWCVGEYWRHVLLCQTPKLATSGILQPTNLGEFNEGNILSCVYWVGTMNVVSTKWYSTVFVLFVAMHGVCVVTLDSTIEVPMGLKTVKSEWPNPWRPISLS